MADIVVRAEGLGKKYMIGHKAVRAEHVTFRSEVARKAEDAWAKVKNIATGRKAEATSTVEEFWALKDVSFEIGRGEITGIIGRNGAGKSTLLKILSGITEPSEGRVAIEGQIASLLEVGTGFHPELTGRENIYLNGAILGMSRAEVNKKFDEIVSFAGIEKFLDTPVKRYSSGMYVRLAFSVAAHLEPDILIVDEVLAVGDAEFQKKCLGKVEEVAQKENRTILLVSHNMALITSLCRNAILLEGGRIVRSGPAHEVVSQYSSGGKSTAYSVDFERSADYRNGRPAVLLGAQVLNSAGQVTGEVDVHSNCKVAMRFRITKDMDSKVHAFFRFWNSEGQCAFVSTETIGPFSKGDYRVECAIPANLLNLGVYFVDVALTDVQIGEDIFFHEQSALSILVTEVEADSQANNFDFVRTGAGVLRPKLEWAINRLS